MIVSAPSATPVTVTPPATLLVPTVAIDVLLLLHVPPAVVSRRVMNEPTHTSNIGPMIAVGSGLTVIVNNAVQPDDSV